MSKALVMALCLATGASQSTMGPSSGAALNPRWGVLFSAEAALTLLKQCHRQVPDRTQGTWQPAPEDLLALEKALPPAVERALDDVAAPSSHRYSTAGYYRQYGGIILADRRLVYVNAFHQTYLDLTAQAQRGAVVDWRHKAVRVCDGGTMFFGALYDPSTEAITEIRFNCCV